MAKKTVIKRSVKTPALVWVGFWLGILALIPMCIMTVDFIIPARFANMVAKMPAGAQTALVYYCMFGSLPFSIASLVTGILAVRRIKRDKQKGSKWAILAIVLGCLGLIFGVFLYFHFLSLLPPTPPLPV